MIQVRDLGHRYGDNDSLIDLNFSIAAGEKTVLLGSNGCGKSTLLKILDGLIAPTWGNTATWATW